VPLLVLAATFGPGECQLPPPGGAGTSFVVGAAGDYNGSATQADPDAVGVMTALRDMNPVKVLGLGDYNYAGSAVGDPAAGFELARANAGLPKGLIAPTAGPTHDVGSGAGSSLYSDYWGRSPLDPYSFDIGNWHFIQLPSAVWRYSSATKQAEVDSWLEADLDQQPASRCILAYWHVPYYSSSTAEHVSTEGAYTKPWVTRLQAARADLLLQGHQHGYERFRDNTAGLTSVTVGTGGVGSYGWTGTSDGSATKAPDVYGALKLTLSDDGYDGQFVRTGGASYSDSFLGSCND
jgi:hypothetical protein